MFGLFCLAVAVLGVQAMVAEEGDAAAADGLARLARDSGLARLGSGGGNAESGDTDAERQLTDAMHRGGGSGGEPPQ